MFHFIILTRVKVILVHLCTNLGVKLRVEWRAVTDDKSTRCLVIMPIMRTVIHKESELNC